MTSLERHDRLGKRLEYGEHTDALDLGSEGDWNIGVGLVENELVLNRFVGVLLDCGVVMIWPRPYFDSFAVFVGLSVHLFLGG